MCVVTSHPQGGLVDMHQEGKPQVVYPLTTKWVLCNLFVPQNVLTLPYTRCERSYTACGHSVQHSSMIYIFALSMASVVICVYTFLGRK